MLRQHSPQAAQDAKCAKPQEEKKIYFAACNFLSCRPPTHRTFGFFETHSFVHEGVDGNKLWRGKDAKRAALTFYRFSAQFPTPSIFFIMFPSFLRERDHYAYFDACCKDKW